MRWLLFGLLVSLGALLLAAAGVARHILLRRTRRRNRAVADPLDPESGQSEDQAE